MRYVRTICTINPAATKVRGSGTDLKKATAKYESKRTKLFREWGQIVKIYFLGTSASYFKPSFTAVDCFYIMFRLLINMRSLILYVDLTLAYGGSTVFCAVLVLVTYVATHVLVCSYLAFLMTFSGNYGARSYMNMWDMCPSFSGIMVCMCMMEFLKIIETGLILSTAFMSFTLYFELGSEPITAVVDINKNCTSDEFTYVPGWGTPYGISEKFTAMGYIMGSNNNYANWRYDAHRGRVLLVAWFIVIFMNFFVFKRFRYFPIRMMAFSLLLFLFVMSVAAMISSTSPSVVVVYSNSYTTIFSYLHIFSYIICDYLPSHWVTIGYLHPNINKSNLIWLLASLRIVIGCGLYYAIPYFVEPFCTYVKCTKENCLQTFGLHFFFVMIPVTIYQVMNLYVGYFVYIIYMLFVLEDGACYIVFNIEMILTATSMSPQAMVIHRFRHIFFFIFCFALYAMSLPFCVNAVHFVLFQLSLTAHYYASTILLTLTLIGYSIYGWDNIHTDHHFYLGSAYPRAQRTKLLLILCTVMLALYILDTTIFLVDREDIYGEYWFILGLVTIPLVLGVILAGIRWKKYHSFIRPLISWGRPQVLARVARRRRDLGRLFVYRSKQVCYHGCLRAHTTLRDDVNNEIVQRFNVLNERINYHGVFIDEDDLQLQYLPSSFNSNMT